MDNETDVDTMMNCLSWFLVAALLLATPLFWGRWITPNAYTVRVARCSVDWHVERGMVAVACQGRDRIEVGPLPLAARWGEAQALECPPRAEDIPRRHSPSHPLA